jgi:hypothetical protein
MNEGMNYDKNEEFESQEGQKDYFEMPLDFDGPSTNIDLNAVKEQSANNCYYELDRVASIMSEFYTKHDPMVVIEIAGKGESWDGFLIVFGYAENIPKLVIMNNWMFVRNFGGNN